jgi:hypothetical protein
MGRTRTRTAAGIVLDAGALIALDHGDKRMIALLQRALAQSRSFRVPAGVVGQAWRDGRVQVTLARFLRSEEFEVYSAARGTCPFLWRTLRRLQHVGYYRRIGGDPCQGSARCHNHEQAERPAASGSGSPDHSCLKVHVGVSQFRQWGARAPGSLPPGSNSHDRAVPNPSKCPPVRPAAQDQTPSREVSLDTVEVAGCTILLCRDPDHLAKSCG